MKKRWFLYAITGLCALGLSACSHEQQTDSKTTTTTSQMTESTARYTMKVKEDGTNDQVLVTMDQKENKDQTVLGDQDFEGYLLLQDVSLKDKKGNLLTGDALKAGDQLTVTLTETPIIARSLPPKIAGASIKSIILN